MEAPVVDQKAIDAKVEAISGLQAAGLKARTDQRLALRRVLSPEQQEKMKQLMRENRGPRGPGRRGRARRRPRPRAAASAPGPGRALGRRGGRVPVARAGAVTSPSLALRSASRRPRRPRTGGPPRGRPSARRSRPASAASARRSTCSSSATSATCTGCATAT
jgi:hypothetical protein